MTALVHDTRPRPGDGRDHAAHADAAPRRAAYRAALARSPRDVALLTEAGVFEAECGDVAAARRHLEKALKLAPEAADIHFNLAEINRQVGALALAERHYRKAVERDPGNGDALYGLGDVLRLIGRPKDALAYLIRAHELAPEDAEILNCLGIALEENGFTADAEEAYRKAAGLVPDYWEAKANLAAVLADRDAFEEADGLFREIPREALPGAMLGIWAHVLLSLMRREEALAVAEEALAKDGKAVAALVVKATILQRHGRFDEAEACARAALKAKPDHADAYQRLATMRRLEPAAAPRLEKILRNERLSSTTRATAGYVLYSLLDRQDACEAAFAALAEANALRAAMRPYEAERHEQLAERVVSVFDADFLRSRAHEGLDREGPVFVLGMPRSGTTLVEQILAAYPEVHAGGERNDLPRLARSIPGYPEQAATLASDWVRETAEGLFADMFADAPGKRFATNKAPGNYSFIGLIAWLFPRARIIHCRRDPLDTGLSCFEQNFLLDITFATDLDAFVHAYRMHEKLMSHWQKASPVPIHTVDYEALVRDPRPVAEALVRHVGLDWRDDCLAIEQASRPVDTASVWQVRQPINAGSVGRWKRYERQLAPLVAAFKESA